MSNAEGTTATPETASPARTVEVPLTITCPTWCVSTAEDHVRDLWEMGGHVVHGSTSVEVEDKVSLSPEWETQKIWGSPAELYVQMATRPDGSECSPGIIYLNDRELSVPQALALADELIKLVELYRSTGGKA